MITRRKGNGNGFHIWRDGMWAKRRFGQKKFRNIIRIEKNDETPTRLWKVVYRCKSGVRECSLHTFHKEYEPCAGPCHD